METALNYREVDWLFPFTHPSVVCAGGGLALSPAPSIIPPARILPLHFYFRAHRLHSTLLGVVGLHCENVLKALPLEHVST